MCTRIKIFRYLVTGCHEKLSSSYRWYEKRTVGPTFVRTESLLSRAIFKNVLGAFYRGWYVVVHPSSNFLCAARWRRYRVSNFKPRIFRFSVHFYCDFMNNVYIFSGTKFPFQRIEQIWKPSLGGAMIGAPMENFQNLRKCPLDFNRTAFTDRTTLHYVLVHPLSFF